jgi:hypothetical protein
LSPLEPETPPVSEEIHLPPPTVVPALAAIGITLTLVGLTTFIELTVAGGLLTLGCVVSWVKTARAEFDELPLD